MTLINPIPQTAMPLPASPAKSPAGNLEKLPDLPSDDGQKIPPGSQEKETASATSKVLQQTVKQLNDFAKDYDRNLQFSVDEVLDRTVITVFNTETNEVVRQIPPEEVLSLARYFKNTMGAILDVLG